MARTRFERNGVVVDVNSDWPLSSDGLVSVLMNIARDVTHHKVGRHTRPAGENQPAPTGQRPDPPPAPPDAGSPACSENRAMGPTTYGLLDAINDDFQIICRLLTCPHAVQSCPEVMDVVNMALAHVCSRYHSLAFQLRQQAKMNVAAHAQERAAEPNPAATIGAP